MRDKKIVPVFKSEAEEAQWWFDHRDDFARDLHQALADGTARVGTVARRMRESMRTIELDPADAELARQLAAHKGIDFQTFVRNLLHDELARKLKLSQSELELGTATRPAA